MYNAWAERARPIRVNPETPGLSPGTPLPDANLKSAISLNDLGFLDDNIFCRYVLVTCLAGGCTPLILSTTSVPAVAYRIPA